MNKTVTHDDWLLQQLADADFAAAFLNAASEFALQPGNLERACRKASHS